MRARAQLEDEQGATLVELLVALLIFAVLLLAVAASLVTQMDLHRDARERSVASTIAASELETLRGIDPVNVSSGLLEYSHTVGNTVFEVARSAEWVSQGATGSGCETPSGTQLAYLRLDVAVTWRDDPTGVSATTVLTPDVGAFSPDTGHVAVTIRDRDAVPVGGQFVRLTGPAARAGVTTPLGCIFFDHLPEGSYDVTVDSPGYVDHQGQQLITANTSVTAGATSLISFDYDRAATLDLTTRGATGAPTAAGALDLTLRNTALTRSIADAGAGGPIPDLFPFTSGYEAWLSVAECADADPAVHGQTRPSFSVSPATTTTGDLIAPTIRVTATDAATVPLPGVPVTATHAPDPGSCASGATLPLGTTGLDGTLEIAMPFGTWTFVTPNQIGVPPTLTLTDASTVTPVGVTRAP